MYISGYYKFQMHLYCDDFILTLYLRRWEVCLWDLSRNTTSECRAFAPDEALIQSKLNKDLL